MNKINPETKQVLENKTGLSKEKINQFEEMSFKEGNAMDVQEIVEALKDMNPVLSKLLISETLTSNTIQSKYGAFPNSTAHCIKEVIEREHSEVNSISNNQEKLEYLSIKMINDKVNKTISPEEGLDQTQFIDKILDKSLKSFDYLPNHLQIESPKQKENSSIKLKK